MNVIHAGSRPRLRSSFLDENSHRLQGDSVNLAARLMQRAVAEDGGVMCELATKRACGGLLQFKPRGDFRIKVGVESFSNGPEAFS